MHIKRMKFKPNTPNLLADGAKHRPLFSTFRSDDSWLERSIRQEASFKSISPPILRNFWSIRLVKVFTVSAGTLRVRQKKDVRLEVPVLFRVRQKKDVHFYFCGTKMSCT